MISSTLIAHSPSAAKVYVGSPAIAKLPSGTLVASHDYFGPHSRAAEVGTTEVYASYDAGESWVHTATLKSAFWGSLFVHNNTLYHLGTSREHGELVIRSSADGHQWTRPVTLLKGYWHTAPVPIVTHNGRLWRAVEDAHTGHDWPSRYRARLISAPVASNFLDPAAWQLSNALGSEQLTDLGATGWLEGNIMSNGKTLTQVMRVESSKPNLAALVSVRSDSTLSFPSRSLTPLPGGTKKFTIRFDTESQRYLALVNPVLPEHDGLHPSHVRNTLALASSEDLQSWTLHTSLLASDDVTNHGFQYADWIFDGADLAIVVRTALPHGNDTPHNFHDANQMTFHRLKNFRSLL